MAFLLGDGSRSGLEKAGGMKEGGEFAKGPIYPRGISSCREVTAKLPVQSALRCWPWEGESSIEGWRLELQGMGIRRRGGDSVEGQDRAPSAWWWCSGDGIRVLGGSGDGGSSVVTLSIPSSGDRGLTGTKQDLWL